MFDENCWNVCVLNMFRKWQLHSVILNKSDLHHMCLAGGVCLVRQIIKSGII